MGKDKDKDKDEASKGKEDGGKKKRGRRHDDDKSSKNDGGDDKEKSGHSKHRKHGGKGKDKDKDDKDKGDKGHRKKSVKGEDKEKHKKRKKSVKGKKGDKGKKDKKDGGKDDVVVRDDSLEFNPRLFRAFRPFRHTLILFGRYPFFSTVNKDTTYTYKFKWCSLGGLYFFLTSLLNLYILIMGTVAVFTITFTVVTEKPDLVTHGHMTTTEMPIVEEIDENKEVVGEIDENKEVAVAENNPPVNIPPDNNPPNDNPPADNHPDKDSAETKTNYDIDTPRFRCVPRDAKSYPDGTPFPPGAILLNGTILIPPTLPGEFVEYPPPVEIDWCPPAEERVVVSEENIFLFENVLLSRHSIILLVIWVALLHNLIVSYIVIKRRKYFATYFGLWSRAVKTMDLNLGKHMYGYCFGKCVFFYALISALSILAMLGVGPSTRGSPALLSLLLLRFIHPYSLVDSEETPLAFTGYLVGANILIVLIFAMSKCYVLYFLLYCRILTNAFGTWNGRVYAAVLRGGDFAQTPQGRTTYRILFKDHCLLLELFEGTNTLFRHIIESYYGLQLFSLCFEIYFVLRTIIISGNEEGDDVRNLYFRREYDWAPGLCILILNVWVVLIICQTAGGVGEEAIAGLEVLRRKTMLGRKTDEELYFMLTMYCSYTAHSKLEICGGAYFYFNKEFIIGVISTISSYFIIIFQFQPVLEYSYNSESNSKERALIQDFLNHVEKAALAGTSSRLNDQPLFYKTVTIPYDHLEVE